MFKNPFAALKKMIGTEPAATGKKDAPSGETGKLAQALGGAENIIKSQPAAETRLLVALRDKNLIQADMVRAMGLNVFIPKKGGDVHILVGLDPERFTDL